MGCPKCGCRVHYEFDGDHGEDGFGLPDDRLQRCADCGHVYDIEDETPEDDDHE